MTSGHRMGIAPEHEGAPQEKYDQMRELMHSMMEQNALLRQKLVAV